MISDLHSHSCICYKHVTILPKNIHRIILLLYSNSSMYKQSEIKNSSFFKLLCPCFDQSPLWLLDLRETVVSMLLNPKALFEEDGSIDHHVDIVLRLAQRVVVIVHIHLHWLTQSLESMIVLVSLARWHSQIILAYAK